MNNIVTQAIVLRRTDFGEADKIITVLTPDHGKISLVAKGVRRLKSKLAGGIELFSINSISYIKGRGELGTLVSSRLEQNFSAIIKDIERVRLGYEVIKLVNNTIEDDAEPEFFESLGQAFAALNDESISSELIRIWFSAQMLRHTGHAPNTQSTLGGKPLDPENTYRFEADDMTFEEHPAGEYGKNEIKFTRLLFSDVSPKILATVENSDRYTELLSGPLRLMTADYLRP
jgi:DNA repair protein RecO (recombination protein O)